MKICLRSFSGVAAAAILLTLVLSVPTVRADPPSEVLAVRPLEQIAPRFAVLSGITVADLIEEIRRKVQITMIPTPDFEPAVSTRDCGAYDGKNGTVQISQDCWQITLSPLNREGFLLHEALGAATYNDHYYEWSSLITAIIFFKDLSPSVREPAESVLLPSEKNSLHGGGSATGVKGGGDAYAFNFKLILLKSTALLFANGEISETEALKLTSTLRDLKITTTTQNVEFYSEVANGVTEVLVERAYVNVLDAEFLRWFSRGGEVKYLSPGSLRNILAVLNKLGAK